MAKRQIAVKCRRCGSHETFMDRRPDRLFQCSACGSVQKFTDADIQPETREERDRRLIGSWLNGNRKDVAEEIARMRRCDVVLFALLLAARTTANDATALGRVLETMKWPA